jgi:hypothetical protein
MERLQGQLSMLCHKNIRWRINYADKYFTSGNGVFYYVKYSANHFYLHFDRGKLESF